MGMKPITVTQLTGYIKRILQTDPLLGNVSVIGEISNLKFHGSGHVYFTLKDETSKINCFLSSDQIRNLHYEPAEGMQVTAIGFLSVYEKGGTYSLYIKDLVVSGKGNLMIAFEQLKEKLMAEGLFDEKYKKPIPKFPDTVAILTSETGAAVRDIIKIIKQRSNIINVIVYPCLVQGKDAAEDISKAIYDVNRLFPEVDVIIIGRGGGSIEELWAYNEEVVARSIFLSAIPVISAVGHETDFTIADFVADLRAATPTEAAQLVAPDITVLRQRIASAKANSKQALLKLIQYSIARVDRYHPKSLSYILKEKHQRSLSLVEASSMELKRCMSDRLQGHSTKIEQQKLLLESKNPIEIMERGYAAILTTEGRFAKGIESFQPGDLLTVIMKNGKIKCCIEEIRSGIYGRKESD